MNYKIAIATLSCLFFIGCSSLKKETTSSNKDLVVKENVEKNSSLVDKKKEYLNLSNGKEVVYNPQNSANEVVEEKEINGTKFIEVYDPLEPLNRRIYYFNYYLDKYLLIPAVNTYEFIAPTVVQKGVSNFFSNLQEINTFINSVLQFEGRKATITLVRFGINSTIGILGLFDVATALELPKTYEDFGLTLAKYGVGNGPYLVLPGFGPSNLRDTTGKAVGIASVSEINPYDSPIGFDINNPGVTATSVVNERKQKKNFRYYGTGSPFEYEYVRYFYTKYRDTLINVNDINERGE
ncbi:MULTISPECIES: MlaA family lipoprotein [Cetobacterium]|uniref:VacJ family lipoprotein n=1 Tax=Candidatus Cetobacterium colombiensis TaxID=3073100 RepID=A0ABU4W778_9FUSO|nr:VacJ family lipoprotein [Candidatus Cetobacterium colombiensis]MDX8335383.1 VacJ family lipoprotein [Candidatus Cetobacterium colombiensis]